MCRYGRSRFLPVGYDVPFFVTTGLVTVGVSQYQNGVFPYVL